MVNVAFFGFVSPLEGSSLLLFLGFGLLAIDMYLIIRGLLKLVALLTGYKWRHSRTFAVSGALIFIVLLSLQSIGQLSVRDAVAVVVVGSIFLVYSSYYRKKR
jgi:hypothetical protein